MIERQGIGSVLAEQIERLLARQLDRDALVAVEKGHFPAGLWADIDALGASLALVPEEVGGAGLCWQEVEGLLRTLGRHAAPVPLGETLVGAALLAAAGLEIPEGSLAVLGETLTLDDDNRVSGFDGLVAWARFSSYWVAQAQRGGECFLCLIERESAEYSPLRTYARIPSDSVRLVAVQPRALAVARGPDARSALAVLRAVQMAGSCEDILALCIDYANTRQQFGKPIGKFQAIQHHLADLAMQVAAAQVAGLYGCRSIDTGASRRGAAVAKIRAGRSAGAAAAIAHQIFGAIGITDEHRLHYQTRRLWQWRSEAGSELAWAEELGGETLRAGGAKLWAGVVH